MDKTWIGVQEKPSSSTSEEWGAPVSTAGELLVAKSYPLSKNQERMWFLERMARNKALYHNSSGVQIRGMLDIDRFEKACFSLLCKHEQLRAVIREMGGKAFQSILSQPPFGFSYINLELNRDDLEEKLAHMVRAPFDFCRGPLCKFILFKLQEDDHLFVLHLHHIISDGWSKGVLFRDLIENYLHGYRSDIFTQNKKGCSYEDYVAELYSISTSETLWEELFPKGIEPLRLVTDRAYPDEPLGEGALFVFQLEPQLSAQVTTLAQRCGVTYFHLLISVYALTLFKCTGQEAFAIGSPVMGRTKKEWENVVGLFANTVVIPILIDPQVSYLTFLEEMKTRISRALSHQHLPFEEIVKKLNPPRDIKRTPLFQVMFQYDNFSFPPMATETLTFFPKTIDLGFAQVDLSMTMWKDQGGVCGSIEYRTDIFDEASVHRFYTYFVTLLERIVLEPTKAIKDVQALPQKEEEEIKAYNQTLLPLQHRSFVERVEQVARCYPENIAIRLGAREMTYADFIKQSKQVALVLTAWNISRGSKLALLLPPSMEMMVVLLAASTLGVIFTILDPEYPAHRQQHILSLFSPDLIISDSILKCEGGAVPILLIGDLYTQSKEQYTESKTNPPIHEDLGDAPLCVIFTSGTTGTPKGVVLTHVSLSNLAQSFIIAYGASSQDKLLSLSSVSFASFLGEWIPMLCVGGTFIMVDGMTMLDGNKLLSFIEAERVSILSTVPSFIRHLNFLKIQPSCLRLLLSGGEAMFETDISHFKSPLKIANGYGLTEASICSSYELITLEERGEGREIMPLGRPVLNTELFVLDRFGHPTPVGCPGEIGVGGVGIMKEYYNDPELTTASFVTHPFRLGEKVLLTSDLGIRLPSGAIQYVGRKDAQVKIRGYRVNLIEIEKKILEHPLVKNVAVKVKSGQGSGTERLIGAVEGVTRDCLSPLEIRKWLGEYFPEYMIPADFIIVPTLPSTSHGKVDWLCLEEQSASCNRSCEMPLTKGAWNRTEEEVLHIWSQLLNRKEIDFDHNFFDLGGHSLLLMEAYSLLKQRFNKKIEITDLFKFPTIRSLANFLTQPDLPVVAHTNEHISHRARMQKQAIVAAGEKREGACRHLNGSGEHNH